MRWANDEDLVIPWLALGLSDAFKDRGDDFYLAESGHLSSEYLIDTISGFWRRVVGFFTGVGGGGWGMVGITYENSAIFIPVGGEFVFVEFRGSGGRLCGPDI